MFVHIGYENYVDGDKILTILKPDSSPAKKLKQKAAEADRLIDATAGHKTRSVIIMTTNHIILCGLTTSKVRDRVHEENQGFIEAIRQGTANRSPG